jgi:hypothetical protein
LVAVFVFGACFRVECIFGGHDGKCATSRRKTRGEKQVGTEREGVRETERQGNKKKEIWREKIKNSATCGGLEK